MLVFGAALVHFGAETRFEPSCEIAAGLLLVGALMLAGYGLRILAFTLLH